MYIKVFLLVIVSHVHKQMSLLVIVSHVHTKCSYWLLLVMYIQSVIIGYFQSCE